MSGFTVHRKGILRKGILIVALVAVLIVAAALFIDVRDLCAHSPHDPIDALAISPAYPQDETLFIAISDHLLRSRDGGFGWKELVNGLDNRYLLSSIAVAPSFPADGTLFAASRGDGIYRSQDGGDSWARVNSGLDDLNVRLLAVHPGYDSSGMVLAAGTEGGLYRTIDGGEDWHRVLSDRSRISAIAFSPALRQGAVLAGDERGTLLHSTDHGESWEEAAQFPDAGAITAIAVSPGFATDGAFFVGTERGGIFKTVDGGDSFVEMNDDLRFTFRGKQATLRFSKDGPLLRRDEKAIASIALSPDYETDATVFVTLWNEAVFKSENGGRSWKRYPIGLTCDFQADSDEYRSPHFRDLRISPAFSEDGTIFVGGFDGLFKSVDGGRHWAQMETLPLGLIKGLALSPGGAESLSVAITTYGGGAYTANDGASRWTIGNEGLKRTRLSGIAFSPCFASDDTLFSAEKGYLLKSSDRGHTWDKSALDREENWRARSISILNKLGVPAFLTKQFLTDTERQVPFATVLAISPDFASDGTLFFGTRYHGVYRSVDGGLHTTAIWEGFGKTITSLIISPDFGSDKTLFASVRGAGIYRSTDKGDTWQPVNDGLTVLDRWQSPTQHQIARKDIHLAISPDYAADKTVFAASSEGLFKTTDGGASWQELADPALGQDTYVIGIAISPDYAIDQTLIVSLRGKGLFKTQSGGADFFEVGVDLLNANHAIEHLAFSASYATDQTVFAASDEALFRSTDGGNSWHVIARPVRYEDHREVVRFEGDWHTSQGDDYSASSVSYSDAAHDQATLTFVGTGISWIGTEAGDQGIARVYLDGDHVGDVDQFGNSRRTAVRSFSLSGLAFGPHTITVEVTGEKNPNATGYRIEIDAFDVAP
jgi:photosystem II stability/assembly factor-like uncharacterized protein